MSARETAKRLLPERDYEVAEETVRLLREFPGVRPVEVQERMERVAWLFEVDLDALDAEDLGLNEDDFKDVFLGVKLARRPWWRAIEGYVLHLTEALEEHRVVAACTHLARLKWSRVRDFKKLRRQLWGESRYWMMDLVRLLGAPYGPWLLRQFEEEMALTERSH